MNLTLFGRVNEFGVFTQPETVFHIEGDRHTQARLLVSQRWCDAAWTAASTVNLTHAGRGALPSITRGEWFDSREDAITTEIQRMIDFCHYSERHYGHFAPDRRILKRLLELQSTGGVT